MKKLILIIMLLISCSGFAADVPADYAPVVQYQTLEYKIPEGCVFGDDGILYQPDIKPAIGYNIVQNVPEVQASNIAEQPLTADTPAVEPAWYEQLIIKYLPDLINWLLVLFTGWISGIYDAIRKWIATIKHGQAIGILLDALRLAVNKKAKEKGKHYSEIIADLIRIVSDLSIDDAEKQRIIAMRNEIRNDAVAIAHESFKQLRGWAKDKGTAWIAERIDLLLGELESRLFDLKEN